MSFRKRSVPLTNSAKSESSSPDVASLEAASSTKQAPPPGVRISPSFSLPTVSTGLASLDSLLRLGAGLALGTSLVIEEDGTTDYTGTILKCFASQGVIHGHKVFILAAEPWGANLPGVAEEKVGKKVVSKENEEKMKIAWRYERLGAHGTSNRDRIGLSSQSLGDNITPFSHTFDLSRSLVRPATSPMITYLPPTPRAPFPDLKAVAAYLTENPSSQPVRLIIPSLLSPLFYSPDSSDPKAFISFLQSIRQLQQKHANLVAILSWPLALYPTHHTLTWWLERLCDGVIRLEPFPHDFSAEAIPQNTNSKGRDEDKMQGFLRVRKLPILTERGMGTGVMEDMVWALGRKRFVIRPFNLPPVEFENGGESKEEEKVKAKELEF
ncbi:PAXNEB-domain-containing protein [Microthyrium microscopicum]|uniref:Elongator complex protein 4 n=1 Tax=Microthyrium microscopicum TaxID=703497 RepID=A0A6A6UKM3_9PEZI|nr:PAXNEB-domain-containing protein [Microthyrium microscopicum]